MQNPARRQRFDAIARRELVVPQSFRIWQVAFAIVLAVCPAPAMEFAILRTGARLLVDRHEAAGDTVRLYQGEGVIELPGAAIRAFEEGPPAPPAPTPKAIVPAVAEESPADPVQLLREAAARHGVPFEFLLSVARAESNLESSAISVKGAIGVMQLMPGTAADLSADPYDVAQNIDAGVRYLRQLLLKYQDRPDQVHLALAAYNAGPGAVDKYGGVPPYRETIGYIRRVVSKYLQARD